MSSHQLRDPDTRAWDLTATTPAAEALAARMYQLGRENGPESAARMADSTDRAPAEHQRPAREAWRQGCADREAAA